MSSASRRQQGLANQAGKTVPPTRANKSYHKVDRRHSSSSCLAWLLDDPPPQHKGAIAASRLLERAAYDAAQGVTVYQVLAALRQLHKVCQRVVLQDLLAQHSCAPIKQSPAHLTSQLMLVHTEYGVTRLHSVPSAFQLVTAAVVFRNILKPTCTPYQVSA